jgi:hypothetical protein
LKTDLNLFFWKKGKISLQVNLLNSALTQLVVKSAPLVAQLSPVTPLSLSPRFRRSHPQEHQQSYSPEPMDYEEHHHRQPNREQLEHRINYERSRSRSPTGREVVPPPPPVNSLLSNGSILESILLRRQGNNSAAVVAAAATAAKKKSGAELLRQEYYDDEVYHRERFNSG